MNIPTAAAAVLVCAIPFSTVHAADLNVLSKRVALEAVSEESVELLSVGVMRPATRFSWMRHDGWLWSAGAVEAEDASNETTYLFAAGPVWHFPKLGASNWSLELSFQPTLMTQKEFGERNLGSKYQFWSNLSFRWQPPSKPYSVSVRIGHISNGSLASHNPGADMIGLMFTSDIWNGSGESIDSTGLFNPINRR